MEIVKNIEVDSDLEFELEMHSILNVLSVILGTLQIMQDEAQDKLGLDSVIYKLFDISEILKSGRRNDFELETMLSVEQDLFEKLNLIETTNPEFASTTIFKDHQETLRKIVDVLKIRLSEILVRLKNPDSWESFDIDEFKDDFLSFFHALEQNSRGRYRIIYNLAEQEEKDYLVDFEISSDTNNNIFMPLLFKDVIRDLIANARKYTPPGGNILIGIAMKNRILKFVVEDNGYGIPDDEIEHVVDYGFRGSNIKNTIRTMGGGFGLTKAYYVTKKLNGRMFIDSKLLRGTTIRIELPVPEKLFFT